MKNKRLIIADDHGIVRKGLRSTLEGLDGIRIVGEAVDGEETIKMVRELSPDILILDISMPKLSGLEVMEIIRNEEIDVKILVLSMYEEEEYVLTAIEAGASGYLHKDADDEELIKAIENIVDDRVYYGNSITQIMAKSLKQIRKYVNDENESLTKRELEILKHIVNGQSNKEIANDLFVSTRTVDTHRTNIMRKLKVRNTADMVRIAIQKRLCMVIREPMQ